MVLFLAACFAAMALFPLGTAVALAGLIERLDRVRTPAVVVLTLAVCLVWRRILEDAERLNYGLILAGLWREWIGY